MYTPITPAGRPAMVARAAKDAMAPPGIPGVPTDRSTFARRIMIIMEMLTLIPHALAKNMIMNDIRMDTASMFYSSTKRNGDTGDLVGDAHLILHALLADGNGC